MESFNNLVQGIINLFNETYNMIFMLSLMFMMYIVFDLIVKVIGRFYLNNETIIFKLTDKEKIILWVSLSIFFAYLT